MQGVCDTSGEQILMSEIKYIIQASYLFGKDKIQLWLSCLALEQGKKKRIQSRLWRSFVTRLDRALRTWGSDGCHHPLQGVWG